MKLTEAQLHDLEVRVGTDSDSNLAREFGVSRERVRQIRNSRHREHYATLNPLWRLDLHTDEIEEFKNDLTTMTTDEVVDKYKDRSFSGSHKFSKGVIVRYRKKFNIPAPKKKEYVTKWQRQLSEDQQVKFMSMLGIVTDGKIAEIFDLPVTTVNRIRIRHNIPAVFPQKNKISK